MIEKPRVFVTLDALRGIAAVAVMFYHLASSAGYVLFPHGYMAVDFFFMLSGFVLSFAYQEKIDGGGFLGEFLKIRFVRLYPIYFVGSLLGFLVLEVGKHFRPEIASQHTLLLIGLCGLLVFPLPTGVPFPNHNAFPLDYPSWSLFGEVVANAIHATFLRRRSIKVLCVVAGCLLVPFVAVCSRRGVNFGLDREDIYLGLVRVLFSYVVGMLLYRLYRKKKLGFRLPPTLSCLILLVILGFRNPSRWQFPIDLLVIFALFPMLLILSAGSEFSPGAARVASLLGKASYAVYVLHPPLIDLFFRISNRLPNRFVNAKLPWLVTVMALLIVPLAIAMDKFYDTPVRKQLGRWILRRRHA